MNTCRKCYKIILTDTELLEKENSVFLNLGKGMVWKMKGLNEIALGIMFIVVLAINTNLVHAQETELSVQNHNLSNLPIPDEEEYAIIPEEEKLLIAIDAGHQAKGNLEKEPIGPGADILKTKVTYGTKGNTTGLAEFKLTLMVAQKLEQELLSRGYEVFMIRNTHEVNISNAERAQMANEAQADAFIRIHANSIENSSVKGAMTICQTPSNPYNSSLYEKSKSLSTYVLDEMVAATSCKKRKVWETDTMTGINWSQVPVTIVEMGYMSNPTEDKLMATQEYQNKMAEGMANGIDKYFHATNKEENAIIQNNNIEKTE